MRIADTGCLTVPRLCALYLVLGLLLASEPLWANSGDPVGEVTPLEQRGEWLYEYLGWIDLFSVQLFDEPGRRAEAILGPVPKRLRIRYYRDFSAEAFARVTRAGIAGNYPAEQMGALEQSIARFNALYRPVRKGDVYEVVYSPELGTELLLNGQTLGSVEGEAFAEAFFSIWLGRVPIDGRLRAALLGEG